MSRDVEPIETLRDLLGIARALYLEMSPYAGPIEMDELRSIGSELRESYQRLLKARAGTAAYVAAWRQANRATQRLGVLVSEHASTKAIVRVLGSRLGVEPPAPQFDGDAKIRERVKRG
ncbi:MAG TPA: hypothetical protein VHM25_22275 [Polyangiaceae bacterium]|jgi:hypothetical protein|nr:hypothetical protein [Polyangiaceae bacterium]